MQYRYNQLSIRIPIGKGRLFEGFPDVSYKKVLTAYSREEIIRLAVLLNREYCNQPVEKICTMLDGNDPRCLEIYERLKRFCGKVSITRGVDKEYVVTLENTPLEILRKAYSIPCEKFRTQGKIGDVNKLQYYTLRLITQINEDLMKYKVCAQKEDLPKIAYVNSASVFDILHYDEQNECLYQLVQAVWFFRLLENKPEYKSLLQGFNERYRIQNWREYVKTIFSVYAVHAVKGEEYIPGDLTIDTDSLMTQTVLEELSISSDIDVIPYTSVDEYDKQGNSDYRIFRSKPLFRLKNGDYVVYSKPLLVDRLYGGLYFDFKDIGEKLKEKSVANLFTSDFMEKAVFGRLMEKCVDNDRYIISKDEEEMASSLQDNSKDGLGSPDYFLRSFTSVILFECKDIRRNAWIKEQRDYDLHEEELRNKLVQKTYRLDYENKKHVLLKHCKRVGCGQIAGHMSSIRNNRFQWDMSLCAGVTIYPVLVIGDNRLLATGLTNVLQEWFQECLTGEKLDTTRERPLIVMSPISLLKYGNLFKRDGFEKYFEDYYLSQKQCDSLSEINRLISFDEYMAQYKFDLNNVRMEVLRELGLEEQINH